MANKPSGEQPEIVNLMAAQMQAMQCDPRYQELIRRREDRSLSSKERQKVLDELTDLEGEYLETLFPGQIIYTRDLREGNS